MREPAQFVTDVELGAWPAPSDAAGELALAWHLRQRDPARAAGLLQGLRQRTLPPTLAARVALIEAEWRWLEGKPEEALATLLPLLDADLGPLLGVDIQLVHVLVQASRGELDARDQALRRAAELAARGGDIDRADFVAAQQARYRALADPTRCGDAADFGFDAARLATAHPATRAAILAFRAALAYNQGALAVAAQHLLGAFELQCETGQIQQAVISANNLSESLNQLNDLDTALEWAQRALELARPRGWPTALGPCLLRVGENLRKVGRLELSREMLEEAQRAYQPFAQSRAYAQLLMAIGDTEIAAGRNEAALTRFAEAARRAADSGQRDLAGQAAECLAGALLALARLDDAWEATERGLREAEAQGLVLRQVNLLRLRARVRERRGERPAVLADMQAALARALDIEGYLVPPELFAELAAAHAACGEFEAAYQMRLRAAEAREQLGKRQAESRVLAMQVKLETERVKAEAEQERQRAELLQRTTATLQHLGAIGQEITAELDQERAFEAIHRHVNDLLDAQCFSIYLVDADGNGLTSVFDVEDGQRLSSDHIDFGDPHSYSVCCVRDQVELCVDMPHAEDDPSLVPGTLNTISALFAPLMIGERVLGVMTIQSTRRHAYGENERLIFRTLCAYAAIALDNAKTYARLRDTQAQLVAQEKLAALGALVAGVAHELNTPIGNSLLVTSSLQERTAELALAFEGGTMRRSLLESYLKDAAEATRLIARGLDSAAHLVQTFKQVAVDRATEQRRRFDLRTTSLDIVAILARSIEKAGHRLEVDVPEGIEIDAYPGPYGQVLTNFVNNAICHAFPAGIGGCMKLTARRRADGWVDIEFADDGVGISSEHLSRVFDPFFTTRLGQGGSGLGLSISHNIATALFGGTLVVRSAPGRGASFLWSIPPVAPAPDGRDPHRHP